MIRRVARWFATGAATLIVVVACTAPAGGGATTGPTQAVSAPPASSATSPAASMAAGITLAVAKDAELGDHVTGKEGMSLYVFEKDSNGTSACVDACAANWPPLTVASAADVTAGTGVTGELGTITRPDGTTQVTLDGKPLYYFANDKAAGDTNGQGLNGFWYLVSPAGEAVGEEDDDMSPAPGGSTCGGRYCY